jgi:hypothetical protein
MNWSTLEQKRLVWNWAYQLSDISAELVIAHLKWDVFDREAIWWVELVDVNKQLMDDCG